MRVRSISAFVAILLSAALISFTCVGCDQEGRRRAEPREGKPPKPKRMPRQRDTSQQDPLRLLPATLGIAATPFPGEAPPC
jgi:hypothetical protein